MNQNQKPLKEKTDEEIFEGYRKLCAWTVQRENGGTPEAVEEYRLGLQRIGDYEKELISRGFDRLKIQSLYVEAVFDGNPPIYRANDPRTS